MIFFVGEAAKQVLFVKLALNPETVHFWAQNGSVGKL